MKKVSLMIAALALVLGLSQCKKDEKPAASGEKQHIVLNASFGDSNAKIAEDGIGGLNWTEGDIIKVMQGQTELGSLTCKNAANGTFEGDITTATGDITFTFGEQKFTEQTGALNDAISLSATTAYDPTGNYNVTMTMPHAVLKLNVSALGTLGALTISVGAPTVASVTSVTDPSEVFVAVPADGSQKNYTIGFGGKTATKEWTLAANVFYTKNGSTTGEAIVIELDAPAAPDGALSGLFTIDDYGTKVYFSKGNLQYVKSTSKWQFAANQWETVEIQDQNVGKNYANQDVVSLFGWGTSGWNNGNDYYQPYDTHYLGDDNEELDPEDLGNPYFNQGLGYGPKNGGNCNVSLTGNFANADWGVYNAITNGGGEAEKGKWRTLSKDEWEYLIDEYGEYEVRKGKRKDNVSVNGVRGFVIAPDDWNLEEYPLQDSYGESTSPMTWKQAEEAGLVFLPAAGYRKGTSVYNVGSYGYYWSSTTDSNPNAAHEFYFTDGVFGAGGIYCRPYGVAVRLVSEVK